MNIEPEFQKWKNGKQHAFEGNSIVCFMYIHNKQIIKSLRRIEIETFYSYTLSIIGVCGTLMDAKLNFLSTLND